MAVNPRTQHLLEQFTGLAREIAVILGVYKAELLEQGFTEVQAWVLAQRLEERLMGPVLGDAEKLLKELEPD